MEPTTLIGYADKLTLVGLLFLAVVAFLMGWIVPGKTHDRVVKERDLYLEAATRGMELARRVTTVVMEKKDA
jgi:hypothetical protein